MNGRNWNQKNGRRWQLQQLKSGKREELVSKIKSRFLFPPPPPPNNRSSKNLYLSLELQLPKHPYLEPSIKHPRYLNLRSRSDSNLTTTISTAAPG